MKKLMTILCLLCFAGCACAEMYEQVSDKKVEKKRIIRHRDNNPTNTYWNFGKVPFWTGSI